MEGEAGAVTIVDSAHRHTAAFALSLDLNMERKPHILEAEMQDNEQKVHTEKNLLSPKLTHPALTTLNARSTNFILFFFSSRLFFSCKFSFYNDALLPFLHFPFPTQLSVIGTHTCMQLETFSLKLKGHTLVGVMPKCIVGFTPLFALDCVKILHRGQPAILR